MERGHRLFLDGVEFFNIPEEIFKMKISLVRDAGIDNDEQIFRTKTEEEFNFYGDAYKYLCERRKYNICADINIRIEKLCNDEWNILFIGKIKHLNAIHLPAKCIMRCRVYDNSYSALIRERQSNSYFLNLNKSINDTEIDSCAYNIIEVFKSLDTDGVKKIAVYEVFEVFKYLIRLLTNDEVQVISDVFTTGNLANKYAICTGAMLRLGSGGGTISNSFNNTYLIPEVSYSTLFLELRKCFRLYQSIEFDSNGSSILRIEPENYFFKNNLLLDIPNIPLDLEEAFYDEELYSEIKVGSVNTRPEKKYYVPNLRLYAWNEELYNNCTNCTIQRSLNLVSDWIIDSNIIFDALDGVDAWDKNIFIIELENLTTPKKYVENIDLLPNIEAPPNNYYNQSLNNYYKLINWSGGIPICIGKFYNQEKCNQSVYDTADEVKLQHEPTHGNLGVTASILKFGNKLCDSIFIQNNEYSSQNCNLFDSAPMPPYIPLWNNLTGFGTVINIPFYGQYQFDCQANFTNILGVSGGNNIGPLEEYKWELKILIFTGGYTQLEGGSVETPIEYVASYSHAGNFDDNFSQTLQVTTPLLTLNAGAVVVPIFRIKTIKIGLNVNSGAAVQMNSGYFNISEQKYDFIENMPQASEVQRLLKYKFNYPICFNDFKNIINNRYGIIRVNGIDTWLKEIRYEDNKISEIQLITEQTMCKDCN